MWQKLKELLSPGPGTTFTSDPSYRWCDPGPENPFPVRYLDVRPLTQTVVAASNMEIAEKYLARRQSDGRDVIDAQIKDSCRIPAALRLPHDGAALEGVVFKSDSFDVKWDIYVYDSVFLFARSWSGDLVYRAFATVAPDHIAIHEIECPRDETEIAPSHVYFLLGAHAMRRVLPHRLPADTPKDPETMAVTSFSLFGNLACYATFEDITGIALK